MDNIVGRLQSELSPLQVEVIIGSAIRCLATIIKDRAKFKMSIGSYEYEKFIHIVEPFIIPTMAYTIANPRNDLCLKYCTESRA